MASNTDTYHHEDLQVELIEAGIELAAEKGLQGFSLRQVAQKCGVSHAAPYSHFKDKDALLLAIQEYISEKFSSELEACIKRNSLKENLLEELGASYIKFFVKKPKYFTFLFCDSSIKIDLNADADIDSIYKPYAILKKEVLKEYEKSELTEEQKNDMAISLWAFVHGLTSIAVMKNVNYKNSFAKKLHDFIEVFLV